MQLFPKGNAVAKVEVVHVSKKTKKSGKFRLAGTLTGEQFVIAV